MIAVQTYMEIRSTPIAGVSEADRLAGCQGNFGLACLTQHPASLLQNARDRHQNPDSISMNAAS
jgi:hypothetical protein